MEKIALILIYLTWFSSSSLHSTLCVYSFCNVYSTILEFKETADLVTFTGETLNVKLHFLCSGRKAPSSQSES